MYLSEENKHAAVRAIPGEGLDIPLWILGSSTDSAYLAAAMGLPYAFASHFAPAQLQAALKIYRDNFKPSAQLTKPYTLACINVIAADSDAEAEFLSTSFKQLFLGIITGQRRLLQKPDKNFQLNESVEAALAQMTRFSFIGGPKKIKDELSGFLEMTSVDELMVVSYLYDHQARLRSYEILKDLKE